MARKRRSSEAPRTGSPAWMVTYGDLVTQLLIFFVLLFAMSAIDAAKFKEVLISVQSALGFMPSGRTIDPNDLYGGMPTPTDDDELAQRDLDQMMLVKAMIEDGLEREGLEAKVVLALEERGLVVRFTDSVLFDLGRAEIKAVGRSTLTNMAATLRRLPNQVRVEGHTDNLPIRTANFPTNWELSTTRATNVVRYLVERSELDPKRLSAAGYGEYRPIATNETPEGRQLNRRVDVVILYISKSRLEPN